MKRDPAIVSKTMKAIRGKDTGIELILRKALTEKGVRYRLYSNKVIGHPDILLSKERIAIFADSEFWHGYKFEENEAKIETNRSYWIPKIKRNIERDQEVNEALKSQGYLVLRYWGFEILKDLDRVVNEILQAIASRRKILSWIASIEKKDRTTLGYLFQDDKILLMLRNKKKNDCNQGKYIGVGGHLEGKETPAACFKREVKEETGLELLSSQYLGKIYFLNDKYPPEVMYLFRSSSFQGELIECNEGELSFINIDKALSLPMWEGDKAFFPLLLEKEKKPAFTMSLIYHDDKLSEVIGPIYKNKPKKKSKRRKAK